jgi:anti-sigma factor RsiW
VHPPALSLLGYELIGGRLLPGDKGPVAQFMYGSASGQRLTLYVTREIAGQDTAFRFAKDGPVNVFYWVEDGFGYAISAGTNRDELLKVSQEVYRQLKPA